MATRSRPAASAMRRPDAAPRRALASGPARGFLLPSARMLPSRLALVWSLPLLAALGCQGKGPAPTPTTDAKAAPATKAAGPSNAKPVAAEPADGGAADGGPSPSEIAAVEAANAGRQGPVEALQDDPGKKLGAHLVDPRWFRKTMFGDKGKVLDTKRSQADAEGRFSSLIRFEIADTTTEGCADHLQGLVKDEIPEVKREPQPDGRIQLSGSTDRYKITFICGQTEGKTIAYVSYQWT